MSRVLLIGVGPLPAPNQPRVHATGLRLEAFLRGLTNGGHQVLLGEMLFTGIDVLHQPRHGRGIHGHRRLELDADKAAKQINDWMKTFEPEVIVALTDVGALAAAKSEFTGPLYVDYFGHPMAERQQQAHAHHSDEGLAGQWSYVLPVLLRADRFSVCSNSQRLALLGELGAVGRLNQHTCNQSLIDILPPTIPFLQPLKPAQPNFLETQGVPPDAHVVFSSGGYNTWVDEEMLFRGVEEAMRNNPNIHFVSTGGAIEGHVSVVFERFQERVRQSPLSERFHLLGWLPHQEMLDAMLGAHVGVNCDFASLEGEFGCRNRLLGWLWAGLRTLTTVSSDPTRLLVQQKLVRPIEFGDWQGLAKAILDEAPRGKLAPLDKLQQFLLEHWSGAKELQTISRWLENPELAPDRDRRKGVQNSLAEQHRAFIEATARGKENQSIRKLARETAETLLGSRAIQVYGRLNPEVIKRLEEMKNL